MTKPHVHAELIKAWADGAQIQVKGTQDWCDIKSPVWDICNEYRVKPEPPKAEWIFVNGVKPEGLSDDAFVEWYGVYNPEKSVSAAAVTTKLAFLRFNNPLGYKVMFIRVIE